ncbi:MAG: hypothetical protein JWM82_3806 [Myxococcales bacterium]|jgi:hypothetical protein|nr:hypothetical protein [Myxococcales bacterium]
MYWFETAVVALEGLAEEAVLSTQPELASGQAVLAEYLLEGGSRSCGLHVEQRAAREKGSAVVVQQRQRVAVDAVASPELTFEVDRPDLVRRVRTQRRRAWVLPLLASTPTLHQTVAFQDVEDGAPARSSEANTSF